MNPLKIITIYPDGSGFNIQEVPNTFSSVQAQIDWCVEQSQNGKIAVAGANLNGAEPFDPVSPGGEYQLFAFDGALFATNIR